MTRTIRARLTVRVGVGVRVRVRKLHFIDQDDYGSGYGEGWG